MESFCCWRKHKKDLNSRNKQHACKAKWIDWRHIKQYHPRNSLAREFPVYRTRLKDDYHKKQDREKITKRMSIHHPEFQSRQEITKKFECLHPTRSFLLLLCLSVHLEFTKTNYWKHLHHHKTQAQIWYQSPCLDGAQSDHKQKFKETKICLASCQMVLLSCSHF